MALPEFVKTPYIFEGKVQLVQQLYPSTLYELSDPLMPEKLLTELFERLKEGDFFTTEEVIELKKEYFAANKEAAVVEATEEEESGITSKDKTKWSQRWLLDQFDQRISALIEYAQQSGIFETIENLDPDLKDVLEQIQEKMGNFAEELWQLSSKKQ